MVGNSNGFISVIPVNSCGIGLARTLDVTTSHTIDGFFNYDNIQHTILDSVWVFLVTNGNKLDSVQTDTNGHYIFHHVPDGVYNITATTNKPWENVNFTDAAQVTEYFVFGDFLTSSITLHSGDVTNSSAINATDATEIVKRVFGQVSSFPRGNWIFEKPFGGDTTDVSTGLNDTVVVNGTNVTQYFLGRCVGDVDYNTCSGTAGITKADTITGCSPGIITVPLHIPFPVPQPYAAITLMLEYDGSVLSFDTSFYCFGAQFSAYSTMKRLIIGDISPISISNGQGTVYLNFTYYGGTTSIVFNNSIMDGIMCEYADINVNPLCDTPTANYYINGAVIQSTIPTVPAFAILNSIIKCPGLPDTLGIVGGCLGDATNWFWYSGSCGGTPAGSGSSIIVYPTALTEYFVRAEGLVHTTACDSMALNISHVPPQPGIIFGNSNPVSGEILKLIL